MPRNNSKQRRDERRESAVDRMRAHATTLCVRPTGKDPHGKADHADMLKEADRIEGLRR